eukprot:m.12834 g.12834  ORF g.12834 m.12834 type:complete len:326 (-) comp7061_c0_seq1:1104-2081(-)
MQKSSPLCTSLCISAVILAFISIVSTNTAAASFFSSSNHNHNNYKRVRLQDVQVLTFVAGEMTTARRSSPVPQMSCVGGSARCHSDLLPSTMQCRNVGSDGVDVQWKCDAEVDNSVKLGRTTVSCEGYEYPDDPFILAGSCGVEYTLESTGDYSSRHGYYAGGSRHQPSSGGNHFFLIIVLGVLAYQLYKWCSFGTNRHGGDPLDRNRWGGPHGGGYNGGPPPDYPGGPGGPSCSPPPYSSVNPNTGGGWNFWHGFGLGGVLGALFAPRRNYGYGNAGYGYGGYGTRPGWGSGYRTQYNTGSNHGFGSSSSGTHTSTGFGGTRRR